MIVQWLVLATMGAAQARGEGVSAAMGYPRPATRTDRASLPIEHPTSGKGAVPIKDKVWSWVDVGLVDMASLLTDAERAPLCGRAEMDAAGWFPAPPPPDEP